MGFDARKLRTGELVAGGGGVLLLAVLFLIPSFEAGAGGAGGRFRETGAAPLSLDGWQALTTTRWVLLVTIAATLALVTFAASHRTPALAVLMSMLTCLLGGLASVLLLYRLIDHPGLTARVGIYVGFLAALVIAYGGYLALRTEGSWFGDPRSIETVSVGTAKAGSEGRGEPTSAGRPSP